MVGWCRRGCAVSWVGCVEFGVVVRAKSGEQLSFLRSASPGYAFRSVDRTCLSSRDLFGSCRGVAPARTSSQRRTQPPRPRRRRRPLQPGRRNQRTLPPRRPRGRPRVQSGGHRVGDRRARVAYPGSGSSLRLQVDCSPHCWQSAGTNPVRQEEPALLVPGIEISRTRPSHSA